MFLPYLKGLYVYVITRSTIILIIILYSYTHQKISCYLERRSSWRWTPSSWCFGAWI